MKSRVLAGLILLLLCLTAASAKTLDFELYRKQVEPIFLKKRPTHARCIVCHGDTRTALQLQPLAEGQKNFTMEQSRKNFTSVSRLVNFNNINESAILKHPLAHAAGGDEAHSGGEQFKTREDPDWKAIADWIKQAKD